MLFFKTPKVKYCKYTDKGVYKCLREFKKKKKKLHGASDGIR